jgi:hypothetical protein
MPAFRDKAVPACIISYEQTTSKKPGQATEKPAQSREQGKQRQAAEAYACNAYTFAGDARNPRENTVLIRLQASTVSACFLHKTKAALHLPVTRPPQNTNQTATSDTYHYQ